MSASARSGAALLAASLRSVEVARLRDAVLMACGTVLTPAEGFAPIVRACSFVDVHAIAGVELARETLAVGQSWGANLEGSIRAAFRAPEAVEYLWRRVQAVNDTEEGA